MSDTSAEDYEFDVAVSLAGEDRAFVEKVVSGLRMGDVRVFYDRDQQPAMWGENLVDFLGDVYGKRARYAILFISEHYAKKIWPNHERQNAQARALRQMDLTYLLPVRLDDTELPGLPPTIGYLDGLQVGADGVVQAFLAKRAGQANVASPPQPLRAVPRTSDGIQALTEQQPGSWEWVLYAAVVRQGIEGFEEQYHDHVLGYARANGQHVPLGSLPDALQRAFSELDLIAERFNRVLTVEAQAAAFGLPGEPGSVERITHLATRLTEVHGDLLAWSARLRGTTTQGSEARAVLDALAHYTDASLAEMRDFSTRLVASLEEVLVAEDSTEPVQLNLTIAWVIPDEATARFDSAFETYRRKRLSD